MKIRLILLPILLLVVSGCAGMNWHCESDIAAVAEACTRAQVQVMRSVPVECPNGATAEGKVSAIKSNPKGFTRHRSEAVVVCKNE